MSHESWLETADVYALGVLDGEELERFVEHLAGCAACQKRVHETEHAVAEVAALAPSANPSPKLRLRILEGAGAVLTAKSPAVLRARRVALALIVFATTAVIAGSSFMAVRLFTAPDPEVHSERMTEILKDPALRPVLMADAQGSAAQATFYWNPAVCGGCFVVNGLNVLSPKRIFQLWAIPAQGDPVPLATFRTSAKGTAHVDVEGLDNPQLFSQFAVSIEPRGGSLKPTGPVVLLGSTR